jgi:hypothetical protein
VAGIAVLIGNAVADLAGDLLVVELVVEIIIPY